MLLCWIWQHHVTRKRSQSRTPAVLRIVVVGPSRSWTQSRTIEGRDAVLGGSAHNTGILAGNYSMLFWLLGRNLAELLKHRSVAKWYCNEYSRVGVGSLP